MGKQWRRYQIGPYRLQSLNGQVCAVWRDANGRHRHRLGTVDTESEARGRLAAFAAERETLLARSAETVGDLPLSTSISAASRQSRGCCDERETSPCDHAPTEPL